MSTKSSAATVLLKNGLRSDTLWTNPLLAAPLFKKIPFRWDVAALAESQYWPHDAFEDYAWEKIRRLAREAAQVPFWRDTFRAHAFDPRSFTKEDFSRLPVITRADFFPHDTSYWTRSDRMKGSIADRTSGSTGRPFEFYLDASFELRSFAICERMLRVAAGGERVPVVSLRAREKPAFTFFGHHLFFVQNYNGVKNRFTALVEFLRSLDTEVILYGFASAFIELGHLAREQGITLPVRAAMSTGEGVRAPERHHIEESLHTKFFTNYATRELGWLAFECEERVLHLNEEWAYVEIVGEDGRPLPDGEEGMVVITVFENKVMPLIRYSNGDRGVISRTLCRCGRTLRTIRVGGRHVEYIALEDGRKIAALDLACIFDPYPRAVRQFQIRQTAPLAFTVLIVAGSDFDVSRPQLEARLIQLVHPRASVIWEHVTEIPAGTSGKAVYFVPHTKANA